MKELILYVLIFLVGIYNVNGQEDNSLSTPMYWVPNFHPASCGWLADFSTERNYCANSYFSHLDRVAEDHNYNFVISEVNNMIAMLNFQPKRFEELKQRISEGRVEPVNGMFLELSPNLSGGEAIVRMGVNGINWQKKMLGFRPRFNWMIDVTGMNEQMAQIGSGLGFEAQVYCRNNISNHLLHWAESPDGTKLLTVSGGHYSDGNWRLTDEAGYLLPDSTILQKAEWVKKNIIIGDSKTDVHVPEWSPYLVLQGKGDYAIPPENINYASDVIGKWKDLFPKSKLEFSTFSKYFDVVKTKVFSKTVEIPTVKGGWSFSWDGFWIENEVVKSRYRKAEHLLQSTEMLATVQSLNGSFNYPVMDLYHAWLQLHLNTDRNTIWGAAGGMVFEHEKSWDVNDRFNWIHTKSDEINTAILGNGNKYLTWFNPLNWSRKDPQIIQLPKGKSLKGIQTQKVGEQIIFSPEMLSTAKGSIKLSQGQAKASQTIALPEVIKTNFFNISIDPQSGELKKIALTKSGKTIIDGGGNIIVAEQHPKKQNLYHQIPLKKDRVETASTRGKKAKIKVEKGSLATIIEITTKLYKENDVKQIVKIYNDYPRIDFDLYLNDIPDKTLVSTEFPLKPAIQQIRRGIPYGFAEGSWPEPTNKHLANVKGINPAIRWSDYQLDNKAAFALLDRGVTGREHFENTARIALMIAADKYHSYESNWLSGKGEHHFQYAIVAYEGEEMKYNIPRMAWEYNNPAIFGTSNKKVEAKSFFTSSDNIILHSCQRVDDELELRFAESKGKPGKTSFTIEMAANSARLTNLLGEGENTIQKGKDFSIRINPQQIVTVRIKTPDVVKKIVPLTDWTPLVPESKREFLNKYDKKYVGHPPR